jgi:GT2 family glycosyltransferase
MPTVAGAMRRLKQRVRRVGGGSVAVSDDDPSIDLLMGSSLFDHAWYSLCVDRPMDRRAAVEHYLAVGREAGLTPHPLFSPELSARRLGLEDEGAEEPLTFYLRKRRFRAEVHPLFDVRAYVAARPAALKHPDGPIGHYVDVGAAEGERVNDWYQPDPSTQPRGLVDWLWAEAQSWVDRQRIGLPAWGGPRVRDITRDEALPLRHDRIGMTTVVLVAERPGHDLGPSIQSLVAQTTQEWELIVLGVGQTVDPATAGLPEDPRIRVEPQPQPSVWAARNKGLALARGTHVAWMSAAAAWLPGRLSSVHRALADADFAWAHDALRELRPERRPRPWARRATRARLLAGGVPELDAVVVACDLANAVGGFDESLQTGHAFDFMLRLSERAEAGFAPGLGVVLDTAKRLTAVDADPNDRPMVEYERQLSTPDVVLNQHLIDWEALERQSVEPALVSVVIPTYHDWEMTSLAVRRVVEARDTRNDVEVIVVDNGCNVVAAAVLRTLPMRYDGVRLVVSPVNRGFALGNNLGVAEVLGGTVVFLNNDTEVEPGWVAPLLESLSDDDVLGAQSLLLYPDGSVQSAGIVFPRGKGLPHVLLQGFTIEDTVGLETEHLHALTGAALAMRRSDIVTLRGFDPIFRNGMEDIDICLRLESSRPGRFVVRPDSRVIHHESKTVGRFSRAWANRRILVDRWAGQFPEDDIAVWGRRGYDVIGHRILSRMARDRRLCVAEPTLTRRRPQVVEGPPSLRWAIKHAAPYGPEGEKWGDTHFARRLAVALRDLGQEVVIDARGAFERSGEFVDDVVLVLRGLASHTPVVDRVNLMWLISHPDDVERFEHVGYDRVYVASAPFARMMADEWGAPAVPLLQATDPTLFHPDLAEPDTGARVLFIGNSRRQARPLVVGAAEQDLELSVYGTGWEGLVDGRFIRGTYVPNDQVGAAYRAAGVVLNDHWTDMWRLGFLSNRLFDAVAAGARVVTDDAAGVKEVFGDAVQVVSDPADLSGLIKAPDLDAVFGDDEARRARAAKVAAEHSFAARAQTLLDDALRIRASRGLN